MSEHIADFDAPELMSSATLTIEVTARLHGMWRIRLGCWLIKLAARVMGCGVNVSVTT